MRKHKSVWTRLKKKKGAITFPVLLGAGAMFLGGLFFMADMPLKLILSNEMVDTVNNAAAAAVTQIDEDEVKYGSLVIDPESARNAVQELFQLKYYDHYDVNPANGELTRKDVPTLKENVATDPEFSIIIVNKTINQKKNLNNEDPLHEFSATRYLKGGNAEAVDLSAPVNGSVKLSIEHSGVMHELAISETSVIVSAKVTHTPLIRKDDDGMTLERFAMSQVSFPDYMTVGD